MRGSRQLWGKNRNGVVPLFGACRRCGHARKRNAAGAVALLVPNAKWVDETDLTWATYTSQANEIVLDTSVKYQVIAGWGGSPNEVGMVALHTLPRHCRIPW